MFSGRGPPTTWPQMLLAGADDYLTKPFSIVQLLARVKACSRLKDAQDRATRSTSHLLAINAELEHGLQARDGDLVPTRNGLVLALAKLVEHRDSRGGGHLAAHAALLPRGWPRRRRPCRPSPARSTPTFIDLLECCAPLHDIGKVGLPDHILLKPGKLTPEERAVHGGAHDHRRRHPEGGRRRSTAPRRRFLQMAIDITRHHHERFDGTGYPDRLAGDGIPLAARIVRRRRRLRRPAVAAGCTSRPCRTRPAVQIITDDSPGQFDPNLLEVFKQIAPQLDGVFRAMAD